MYPVSNRETIISFSGHLSYEKIGNIINQLKDETKDLNLKLTVYKKLLSATIEILENIYKYHEFSKRF
ncbi:MAG: hypothetical protein HC896_19075 [Bacteroidales bacterium]|nr:hypothetical protein [Bacteroidales bacterium]